jgi:uncharacterized protein (TIGR04255 family)
MQEFGFQAGTHNEPVANFNSQQVGYKLSTESGNRSMRLELGSFAVAFNGGYYPNWPGLSDFFNEHLYRYLQHSKQSQFTRIGLRVANRLSFPLHESANTSEYLKTDIRLPQIPGFPSSVEHFRTEASVPFQNGYSCRIVQHTDGVEVNEAADTAYLNFVLDTDAARVVDFGVKDVSFLEETFHQLREIKNLAFFGTFTDKALSRYE